MDLSTKIVGIAVKSLEEKKAEDLRILDISQVSTLADYFLITNGRNRNQLQAMADDVEEKLAKAGIMVKHKEGYDEAAWILMDYGDVVLHLFDRENREFYQLEKIWADAQNVDKTDFEGLE
ncbi:MAG: ribosome silencing factor [Lachnospiraceae bacterium]|nr:ribosome silencing factor [Lachnospiraceae bacterium]